MNKIFFANCCDILEVTLYLTYICKVLVSGFNKMKAQLNLFVKPRVLPRNAFSEVILKHTHFVIDVTKSKFPSL